MLFRSIAAFSGFLYPFFSTPAAQKVPSVFPTSKIIFPLVLVAISSSLASPFGYAALDHIDYLTFILAKACKLVPVMLLNLAVFRRRYPLYKYVVVMLVTLGVATFTLYHPGTSKKAALATNSGQTAYGLFLLFINLLLDGLTFTINLPADYPQASLKLLENPLPLALESMRGRPSLSYVGVERMDDLYCDFSGGVTLYDSLSCSV